jgi:hypothetical protein
MIQLYQGFLLSTVQEVLQMVALLIKVDFKRFIVSYHRAYGSNATLEAQVKGWKRTEEILQEGCSN